MVYVTENGTSADDRLVDGEVNDQERIDFLSDYLGEVRRAMDDGVKVKGYFQWSFMDNFEWAVGYKQRWGIVYVDFPSLCRTPKPSAYWYLDLIASGGYDR